MPENGGPNFGPFLLSPSKITPKPGLGAGLPAALRHIPGMGSVGDSITRGDEHDA
jgi:hypothetical protein